MVSYTFKIKNGLPEIVFAGQLYFSLNLLVISHSGAVVMNVDVSHRREKGASKDLP